MSARTTVLLGTVAAVALASAACRRAAPESGDSEQEEARREPAAQGSDAPLRILYPPAPGSFVELAAEIRPSVVHLRSPQKVPGSPGGALGRSGDRHAIASGFIVDRDGHILTSDQAIARARDIDVHLADGAKARASLVGRDPRLGVALLKIDARADLVPAPIGDPDALEVGAWVLGVGEPLGDGMSAAAGIVSALGRGASLAARGPDPRAAIRLDADVAAEAAGGPLLNMAGEVVGIVLPRAERTRRGSQAAPISRAMDILPMLKEHGGVTRAWLGVFVHPVSEERAERRGMEAPRGALVTEVVEGSPSAEAGLRPGDIVLAFEGEEIDHRSLPHVAATAGIGKAVTLEIRRGAETRELTLVTEAMPE